MPVHSDPYLPNSNIINSVTFSPDGSRIVTGSDDCTLKVWNVATGDLCLGPLTGHTDEVWSVAFSHDGTSTCIASGSKDRTIRIWDASTGESRRGPLIGHISAVFCVAFSADGHYLASGAGDETIRLWDVTQGFTEITTVTLGSSVRSLSFSPTNNCLVQVSETEHFASGASAPATSSRLARRSMVIADLCIRLHSRPTGVPLLLAPTTKVLNMDRADYFHSTSRYAYN